MALPLFPGDRDLRWSLRQVRYGYRYRVVGLKTVPVDMLRVRKEPTLVALPGEDRESRFSRPGRVLANPVDRFFPLRHGCEDRRLRHLPHMAVLQAWDREGALPEDSDYARLLRVRALLQGRHLEEREITRRLQRLVATCQSIRQQGYLGPGHRRQRIVALANPIHPETGSYRYQGLELFDGHHRAVAVTHLGLDTVEVLLIRGDKQADFPWQAEPLPQGLWESAGPQSASSTRAGGR